MRKPREREDQQSQGRRRVGLSAVELTRGDLLILSAGIAMAFAGSGGR